jgi:hypothetical protein
MKWLTWENVGVDRIGCAWLIRRSIDPKAESRSFHRHKRLSPPTAACHRDSR